MNRSVFSSEENSFLSNVRLTFYPQTSATFKLHENSAQHRQFYEVGEWICSNFTRARTQMLDLQDENWWRSYLLNLVSDPDLDEATRRQAAQKFQDIISKRKTRKQPDITFISNLDLYSIFRGIMNQVTIPDYESGNEQCREGETAEPLQKLMGNMSNDFIYLLVESLQSLLQPVVYFRQLRQYKPIKMEMYVGYATDANSLIYMGSQILPGYPHYTEYIDAASSENLPINASLVVETLMVVYTQEGTYMSKCFEFSNIYADRSIQPSERVVEAVIADSHVPYTQAQPTITPAPVFSVPTPNAQPNTTPTSSRASVFLPTSNAFYPEIKRFKHLTLFGKVTRKISHVRSEVLALEGKVKTLHQCLCEENSIIEKVSIMRKKIEAAEMLQLLLFELKDLQEYNELLSFLESNANANS